MKDKVIQWFLRERQMSEAFINSIFLAMSGGFQDAYTYFARGGVYSNAQTGNVVLLSDHLMSGEWNMVLKYLFPLIAFASGIFIADIVHSRFKYAKKMHWRQGILVMEIFILFFVGFLPHRLDSMATILVSFSCALQVQTFRKVSGYSYASTMCIGNIRNGTSALADFVETHNKASLRRAFYYYGIIFFFGLGAGIGGLLSRGMAIHVIWVSSLLLLISYLLMDMEKLR